MTKPGSGPDGKKSQMEHELEIREQTGITSTTLKQAPTFADEIRYLWDWYLQLASRRTAAPMGANAITWSDMQAFFGLLGISPAFWEVETIVKIDNAFLISRSEEVKKKAPSSGSFAHVRKETHEARLHELQDRSK